MTPLLLANENFPSPSVKVLRQAGFDVLSVAEQHPGLPDHEGAFPGRKAAALDSDFRP